MMAILEGQTHNTLLPAPLPPETKIAHKTGMLHDTLNDVGIVELQREPYVIAVMTTHLPSLDMGRTFIRGISRLTYQMMQRVADWREQSQLAPADAFLRSTPPDLRLWLPKGTAPSAAAPDAGSVGSSPPAGQLEPI